MSATLGRGGESQASDPVRHSFDLELPATCIRYVSLELMIVFTLLSVSHSHYSAAMTQPKKIVLTRDLGPKAMALFQKDGGERLYDVSNVTLPSDSDAIDRIPTINPPTILIIMKSNSSQSGQMTPPALELGSSPVPKGQMR
jgi:hypothetical protein